MNRKAIIDFFTKVEHELPVQEWRYGNIFLWPLIKKEIFYNWFREDRVGVEDLKRNIISKVFYLGISILKWWRFRLKKFKQKDVLFFGQYSHRVIWNDLFINRYSHSIVHQQALQSYFEVELGDKKENVTYSNPKQIIFIKNFLYVTYLLAFFKKKQNLHLPQWDQFIDLAHQKTGEEKTSITSNLHFNIKKMIGYNIIFKVLLKKFRPKVCYSFCYYTSPMFAMNYTANSMKIETVDVQHGGQGVLHPMFHFEAIPPQGYNILPKIFWCWDKASTKDVQSWLNHHSFHKVECKGNPWIQFQLEHESHWQEEDNIILYTLQEKFIDAYILEAIQNTPNHLKWWLRLHPSTLNDKDDILQQLKQHGVLNKVEIDKAISYALPLLLKHAKVHISKFSGSIIEAAQVQTLSIIIDSIGVVTYDAYIKNGDAKALLSKSSDDLLNLIDQIINK